MVFLRAGHSSEATPHIRGGGLYLRPPAVGDYAPWAELRNASRAHLQPWEPQWARDELSRSAYRRRVRHYWREARDDQGYAFFVLTEERDVLVGGVTLANVQRGVTQSAALGYWVGAGFSGRGLMSEAVRVLLPYCRDVLRLHRVEAATMPGNDASIRVLERNGFVREGYARRYLKIGGAWQDHVLYARVLDELPREGGTA